MLLCSMLNRSVRRTSRLDSDWENQNTEGKNVQRAKSIAWHVNHVTAGTVKYYEINQTCGIPKPHNTTANVPGLIVDMVNNPPLKALHNVQSNMYKTVEP